MVSCYNQAAFTIFLVKFVNQTESTSLDCWHNYSLSYWSGLRFWIKLTFSAARLSSKKTSIVTSSLSQHLSTVVPNLCLIAYFLVSLCHISTFAGNVLWIISIMNYIYYSTTVAQWSVNSKFFFVCLFYMQPLIASG